MTTKPKVLMVGWDGATFDIIGPMVAAGRLPNVARLMRDGVWGRMESTIPALTPTAWTSMSTGVNPGNTAYLTPCCSPERIEESTLSMLP